MRNRKVHNESWFPLAMIVIVGVILYVGLTHLSSIYSAVRDFFGYFSSVFIGCAIAYILNPLAVRFENNFFHRIKKIKLRWILSITLSLLCMLCVLALFLGLLIPQLIDSIMKLMENMDGYIASLKELADKWGLAERLKLDDLISSSGAIINRLISLVTDNLNNILSALAITGKSLVTTFISLILSIYLLAAKRELKASGLRLYRALVPIRHQEGILVFIKRCDAILVRYITFTLLDSLIVGTANMFFMLAFNMQYIGLVSMVVALTNLIPTFGPVIGTVIGGFILLLINPVHALAFIIFTLVLQTIDGYVIKPRLFGGTLGVSGLLILISIVVFGNIFGMVGILLAIPLAAILDFSYKEEILPVLERHRKKKDSSQEPEVKPDIIEEPADE
ncbi:MAG: AI-2E family transporter [Firmicutes bacterium]|nr:AI-2E family transporter [Bacillota bacterium]